MSDRSRGGRKRGLETLGQEGGDDAGEDIARAGGCQSRSSFLAYDRLARGRDDYRVGALEQRHRRETIGALTRGGQAVLVHPGGVLAEQARQLAGVRCQHDRRRPFPGLEPEQGIGVHDRRQRRLLEQLAHESLRLLRAPDPRSEREGLRARLELGD